MGGHSSFEVTKSGIVINPEDSWLEANPDNLILMDYLKSSPYLITISASQKYFFCWLEKGKLEPH